MGFLAQNISPNLEEWELEEEAFLKSILSTLSPRRRLAALLSIGMVTAVEVSNRISVNVFLPDMQGNVGASSDEISWVIILYNVGYLCSLALAAWMTRVIGTRRHLLLSIGLYAVGSMGCVTAHSLHWLLISRLIMGFGGGAFLVRVVILSGMLFPGREKLAAVTRLYLLISFFEVLYPVSTGWITDLVRWNYAFLIDFPFLAIGAFLIWKLIPPGFLFERKAGLHIDVLPGNCPQPRRTRPRVRVVLDFAGHDCGCHLLNRVCVVGIPAREHSAGTSFANGLAARFLARSLLPGFNRGRIFRRRALRHTTISSFRAGLQRYSGGRFYFHVYLGPWGGDPAYPACVLASPGTSPHDDNRIHGVVRDVYHDRLCHDAHHSDCTAGSHDLHARLFRRARTRRGREHCHIQCDARGRE